MFLFFFDYFNCFLLKFANYASNLKKSELPIFLFILICRFYKETIKIIKNNKK